MPSRSDFTNEKFENLGIGMDRRDPDRGREVVTHKRGDFGKFKTPTLRISLTAALTCAMAASRH